MIAPTTEDPSGECESENSNVIVSRVHVHFVCCSWCLCGPFNHAFFGV